MTAGGACDGLELAGADGFGASLDGRDGAGA